MRKTAAICEAPAKVTKKEPIPTSRESAPLLQWGYTVVNWGHPDVLRTNNPKQVSVYAWLYELTVPHGHFLRKVDALVDFSFIHELVADTYCKHFGRPATEPELLLRLLFLQFLEDSSDEDTISRARSDMAHKWFLGLNPEDTQPDPCTLSRFRLHHIGAGDVQRVLDQIVQQCVDKGLITSEKLLVDATHIESQAAKRKPSEVLRTAAYRILRSLGKRHGKVLRQVDTRVPVTERLGYAEAEQQLVEYLQRLVSQVRGHLAQVEGGLANHVQAAEQILADERLLRMTGTRSAVDPQARIGHKDQVSSFFGYKQHTAMLADDEIITSVTVTPGNADDGHQLPQVVQRTTQRVRVKKAAADTGYSSKDNYTALELAGIEPLIPLNPAVYINQSKADGFTYNKDSDQMICPAGHPSYRRSRFTNNNTTNRKGTTYFFDPKVCQACPLREGCYSGQKIGRSVTVLAEHPVIQAAKEREAASTFKAEYKARSAIEHKFGELKENFGLSRARYRGLLGVTLQAVLTAVAANIKRMVRLHEAKMA
jgi:IS5 family transposase